MHFIRMQKTASPPHEQRRLNTQAYRPGRRGQLFAALTFSLFFHLLSVAVIDSFKGAHGARSGHDVLHHKVLTATFGHPIENTSQVEPTQEPLSPNAHNEPAKLETRDEKRVPANTADDSKVTDSDKSGLVFGPWYFTAKHLHRRPKPLQPVNPVYPAEASNIAGKVLLRLYINEKGDVDKYEIVEESSEGVFSQSAIDAFTTVKYSPGLITGYVVRSQILIEVTYSTGKNSRPTVITVSE